MQHVNPHDTHMVLAILQEAWLILVESAPYILFGFLIAGLLKGLLPQGLVARQLGRSSLGSVVKASLLGIPLPLCSCGVIPAAVGLRQQGANKGASAAFLVSTPESGVDSMAITWALLDPIMTVVRPLAAFVTATCTGVLINRLPDEAPAPVASAACSDGCGCPGESGNAPHRHAPRGTWRHRVREGLSFAFDDLLKDIGGWLLLGVLLAGVIAYLVPEDFAQRWLGGELTSLLVMLVVGVPMYICATASTPIAAALVLKGLSPGAALVFLLAGPATNVATITVIRRFWGGRATAVYLASIAVCSVAIGWLVNRLYAALELDLGAIVTAGPSHQDGPYLLEKISAIVLLLLLLNTLRPRRKPACGCGD